MASFITDKIVMDGLTFDDVLLIPAYSDVLPKMVELKTRFSRNIELNVPFVTWSGLEMNSTSFIKLDFTSIWFGSISEMVLYTFSIVSFSGVFL